jgi:hypothetical protein
MKPQHNVILGTSLALIGGIRLAMAFADSKPTPTMTWIISCSFLSLGVVHFLLAWFKKRPS